MKYKRFKNKKKLTLAMQAFEEFCVWLSLEVKRMEHPSLYCRIGEAYGFPYAEIGFEPRRPGVGGYGFWVESLLWSETMSDLKSKITYWQSLVKDYLKAKCLLTSIVIVEKNFC